MFCKKSATFKRGATFTLIVKLPSSIEDGFFTEWTLKAQVRRRRNPDKKGFIADVSATWVQDPMNNMILLFHADTATWPLGDADLDISFTNADGHVVKSRTIEFKITNGVTQ